MSLLSFPSLTLLKSAQSGRKSNICSVVWHRAKNEAAFCDMTGHWGLVHEVRADTAAAGEAAREDVEDIDMEEDENSFSIGRVLASTDFAQDQDGNLTFGAGEKEGGGQGEGSATAGLPARCLSRRPDQPLPGL